MKLKHFVSSRGFHPLLLLVWIAIGTLLRFAHLTDKPPWTDEFATLVFSLGNSYQGVPLDQTLSLTQLLQPLQPHSSATVSQVIHHLITEDHHPPLYFVLAHLWMQLFPADGGYVSLWAARSLPALFGVISIPAVYGLGWLAFRSRLVAQLAAAMMAVSPYSVFLTQEARHYALGILWVIASLSCLVVAVQHLHRRVSVPIPIVLSWVAVNALGIATHYFFSLTLCAEALVLLGLWLFNRSFAQKLLPIPHSPLPIPQFLWWRIYAVAAGTLVSCFVWVPVWQMSHDAQMTQWIMSGDRTFLTLISPIFQALGTWITMLALLPVESSSLPIVLASGMVMLIFFIWAVPILYQGLKVQMQHNETKLATQILGGFVLSAIAIFFAITYILGTDITRGARYNFVYFPAVPVLLGAALAVSWNLAHTQSSLKSHLMDTAGSWEGQDVKKQTYQSSRFPILPKIKGKLAVVMIGFIGLLSGITVVNNLGYQKYYRPDLLVPVIQETSSVPILIATTHNTLVQTGEMMGLAWEFQQSNPALQSRLKPLFLLAHQQQPECIDGATNPSQAINGQMTCRASKVLQNAIAKLPRPLDVWLVNFKAPIVPEPPRCFAEDMSQYRNSVNGYSARLYHCLAEDAGTAAKL